MNNPLLQIGITGGIASGKSTICKVFAQLGVPVYDADYRAKSIVNTDPLLKEQIIEAFGNEAYLNNEYNRKYIASLVFNDKRKVEKLNAIIHPGVGKDYKKWLERLPSDTPYALKEAALLFESGSYKLLDKIINVVAPEDIRIARIQKRDPHRTLQEIKGIISRQWSDEERSALSDYIIANDGVQLVVPQIIDLHQLFLRLSEEA
jgi:dephospho-CoA kinase